MHPCGAVCQRFWEIDLTEVGGDRYFSVMSRTKKVNQSPAGRQYQAHSIQGSGFEMNGKGASARPTLKVSNLHGMVTRDGGRPAESGRRNGGQA